jgi:hypothetical protein
MTAMSNFLEDEVIKHIFRTGSFTKPTVLAITMLTTGAADGDTGQFTTGTGVEVTNAGSYARVDRPPLDANWTATAGGDGQTDNAAAITFTTATADWSSAANITDIAICDSATYDAGNMLFYGSVTVAKAVLNGDTAEFAAGAITVTFA